MAEHVQPTLFPSKQIPPRIVAPLDGLSVKQSDHIDVVILAPNEQNVSSVVLLYDAGNALGITSQTPYVIHWNTDSAKTGLRTLKAQVHY